MTSLADLRHDLLVLGLDRWGLWAVTPDGAAPLDGSRLPPPDTTDFRTGALLLVTDDGTKDVGDSSAGESPTTLLAVLEELQVWAMDVLGRPVPTTADGSRVLEPALDPDGVLVWTAGGATTYRVGELPATGPA